MSSPPEPVNLVEACRAQMAACRELIYARELLAMAHGDNTRQLARYRKALDAAQEATRISDMAQSRARCELPPVDQPELFP